MIRMLSFLQTTLPAGLDRDREETARTALDAARRGGVFGRGGRLARPSRHAPKCGGTYVSQNVRLRPWLPFSPAQPTRRARRPPPPKTQNMPKRQGRTMGPLVKHLGPASRSRQECVFGRGGRLARPLCARWGKPGDQHSTTPGRAHGHPRSRHGPHGGRDARRHQRLTARQETTLGAARTGPGRARHWELRARWAGRTKGGT